MERGKRKRGRRADIEARLHAGEWISPTLAALVLGMDRKTAHRRIDEGKIRFRRKPGSRYRLCDPADVLRLLEESRRIHGGESE